MGIVVQWDKPPLTMSASMSECLEKESCLRF